MRDSKPLAVVTGASSGIGAVYADRLARRGYDLAIVARRTARIRELADRLSRETGAAVTAIDADLTEEAGLERVADVVASDPRLSLLVNNAGVSRVGAVAAASPDDAALMIELNVSALTRLTLAAVPPFLARGHGAIINIASAVSLHSLPITSIYSGTKAYVLAFSRGLQQELAGTGVRLQVVLPAAVATDLYEHSGLSLSDIPAEMVMNADDMVDAALLGFDRGEEITLPSVGDAGLLEAFDAARLRLFAATQSGQPAARYRTG